MLTWYDECPKCMGQTKLFLSIGNSVSNMNAFLVGLAASWVFACPVKDTAHSFPSCTATPVPVIIWANASSLPV